jgi:hypothetical protein
MPNIINKFKYYINPLIATSDATKIIQRNFKMLEAKLGINIIDFETFSCLKYLLFDTSQVNDHVHL